jgi:hypothetical protein
MRAAYRAGMLNAPGAEMNTEPVGVKALPSDGWDGDITA